jgi:hypothetical protein
MDIIISTGLYKNELLCWLSSNGISYRGDKGIDSGGCLIIINRNEKTADNLCELLEDLILVANDVVKSGTSIKSSLKRIVFASHRTEISREIACFLDETNSINLDGFLNFRLKRYKDMVDMILYAAIKNVLK